MDLFRPQKDPQEETKIHSKKEAGMEAQATIGNHEKIDQQGWWKSATKHQDDKPVIAVKESR